MTTLDFKVTGEQTIHCAACEQRIYRALRRVPGVRDVRASSQTQQVVVRIDPDRVEPADVQARLAQMGYEVDRRAHTL